MKLSRNNIYIQKGEDAVIVANSYTRSVILIDNKVIDDINQGRTDSIDKNILDQLFNLGIIIPENLDENKFLEYLFCRQKLSDKCLVTYLIYSTECNFACKYCYEMGSGKQVKMTEEKFNELIMWYKHKIVHGGVSECQIILFGGEPLLNIPKFVKLLESVKTIAELNNVVLTTKVITNGFLLDKSFIDTMMPYNLTEIQVTIDGLPRYHDKLRPLKNGAGTYGTIFSNLLSTSSSRSGITYLCRINFGKHNIEQIPLFLEHLNHEDPSHHITPYFAHVTQTNSQKSISTSFCSNNVISDDLELSNNYLKLWRKAKDLGYKIPSLFTLGPCMYYSANGYLITPTGDLYKCLDMIGVESQVCGNIKNPIHNYTHYYDIILSSQLSFCLKTDCPYIPICCNGCILESWLKHGDTQTIYCKRNFMDSINKGLIGMKYNNH